MKNARLIAAACAAALAALSALAGGGEARGHRQADEAKPEPRYALFRQATTERNSDVSDM